MDELIDVHIVILEQTYQSWFEVQPYISTMDSWMQCKYKWNSISISIFFNLFFPAKQQFQS